MKEDVVKIDKNDFFHQATLLICSSLDIEKVLQRCQEHLGAYIPVTAMFLNTFEPDLGIVQCLAMVTADGINKKLPSIPLPKEAVKLIKSHLRTSEEVHIVNQPARNPVAQAVLHNYDLSNLSVIIMRLTIEDETLGVLGILAEGKGQFTDAHRDLVAILREPFAIAMSNVLRHQEIITLKEMVEAENRELHRELYHLSVDEIIGADFGLKHIMEKVRQVAPMDTPVMLLGESGVGKEVIANAIHYSSPRKDGPFIKVNCGAMPDNLLDSELFGHEKGAFTGAIYQKRGRFERAHGGTLFLDELGDLPLPAQMRLLRVLQNKVIERVGGAQNISVDARIITATHRNLEEMIAAETFREDLWFRLNIFPIIIPPLRQRKEDIPALVHYLIQRKSKELKISTPPTIALESVERLQNYHWPGNVRELENLIERALIQSQGRGAQRKLTFENIVFPKRERPFQEQSSLNPQLLSLNATISQHIQRALTITNGKIHGPKGAAQLLDINPNTLRSKMRKLGIAFRS